MAGIRRRTVPSPVSVFRDLLSLGIRPNLAGTESVVSVSEALSPSFVLCISSGFVWVVGKEGNLVALWIAQVTDVELWPV